MATLIVTEDDRSALQHHTAAWRMTPPCFSPNDRCKSMERRGLIEMRRTAGRWEIRLTEAAAAVMSCAGQA